VQEGLVNGWDDPRMPTISGMRRRGYPAEAIRAFCDRIGVAKRENTVELGLLEYFVRDDLNKRAPRAMAVLRPLKVVIDNYPDGQAEEFEVINNQEDPSAGTRKVPFSKIVYIEQDDFREVPPPKYHRLSPGVEVRLRAAYLITCTGVVKDPATGEIVEVHATYDPATKGGDAPDGRKVKSTIHWTSKAHSVRATVRLYEPLFTRADPDDESEGLDWRAHLNPTSLVTIDDARVEDATARLAARTTVQFERMGYFCVDPDSKADAPVLNRTITLKDSWAKIEKSGGAA